jgi:hypothetical protein
LNPEFDVVVDGLNLGFASARPGKWRNNRNDQSDKKALTLQYKVQKNIDILDFKFYGKTIFWWGPLFDQTKLLDSKFA